MKVAVPQRIIKNYCTPAVGILLNWGDYQYITRYAQFQVCSVMSYLENANLCKVMFFSCLLILSNCRCTDAKL